MAKSLLTLEERFWQKVDVRGLDECHPWTAYRTRHGYGVFRVGSRLVLAHRFAWALSDPVPDGLGVLHHCDDPPCVNRHHLFLGMPKDNAEDRERKGRGHQRGNPGVLHPLAKLSPIQVTAIRVAYVAEDVTQKQLGERYGVSQTHISHIVHGHRWNDLALR